jgi:predicted ester cyclase
VPAESNKALVRRFFDEMCNGRKLEVANEIFSPTHVYNDPNTPAGPGPQGMKDVIATYHNGFSDARWHVDATIVGEGDVIATRWRGTGTHSGSLMGIPPTRRKVNAPGIWIHKISGGKIVESWNHWDVYGMLTQLNAVIPLSPQPATEKKR